MAAEQYPYHDQSEVALDADPARIFAFLDDHARLAGHMEKPSLMMAGGAMRIETDAQLGKAVGSVIHITGRVLGAGLRVDEVVVERVPPLRKTWETLGRPALLVIGAYRMGFAITPMAQGSRLVVFIDYQRPSGILGGLLGLLLGPVYAKWCTRRMTADAAIAMAGG
jgi:hypothetical protein